LTYNRTIILRIEVFNYKERQKKDEQ